MQRQLAVIATLVITMVDSHEANGQNADRPAVTVTSFEYGTVAFQINSEPSTRGHLARFGVHDGAAFAAALGAGASDLVVEQLVQSDRFRVFERKQLGAVREEQRLAAGTDDGIARARYVITGSVTRLGLNNKRIGGIGTAIASRALIGRVVGIDTKQSTTTVHLTARVVDTRTGEIVGSFTGEGKSNKRWSAAVLGILPGGLGGARVSDTDFRETAVGEASARAAAAIAEQVVALRATRLRS
jgi:curli biogenesis system outer membrane secretion channel CsgG